MSIQPLGDIDRAALIKEDNIIALAFGVRHGIHARLSRYDNFSVAALRLWRLLFDHVTLDVQQVPRSRYLCNWLTFILVIVCCVFGG